MANSNIVASLKTKVIQAICKDEDFYTVIDPDREVCENGGDLIWNNIFPYNKNPNTITNVMTFLTVMVHTKSRDRNSTFVTPTLEILIYSHNKHMEMNINGVKDTRADFISKLLDDKFNGSSEYGGIGKLLLVSNTEGTYNQDFLFRRLIFETIDINDSLCESW